MAANDQYLTADPFGGPGGYASTGAGGTPSPGIPVPAPGAVYAAGTEGPAALVLPEGSVMVSNVFGGPSVVAKVDVPNSTQVPAQADGFGSGSDVLTGVPAGFLGRTSDGRGSAGQHDHPNSMWRDR